MKGIVNRALLVLLPCSARSPGRTRPAAAVEKPAGASWPIPW
jgi:hypothetical protein